MTGKIIFGRIFHKTLKRFFMWIEELKDVGFNFLRIAIICPIIGYALVIFLNELKKAWESKSKTKKWLACTYLCVVAAVFYRSLQY